MSFDEDIAGIRIRITKAETDRDRWRTSGRQDKYLEAYFFVNALELELDRARRQRFEQTAKARRSVPMDSPTATAGTPAIYAKGERESLMAEFSITFFAQQYRYAHYRYDTFEDALSYAKQQQFAPEDSDAADADASSPDRIVEAPDELQRRRMNRLGITYVKGVYLFGPYRYDRLADAMSYARLGKDVRLPLASLS